MPDEYDLGIVGGGAAGLTAGMYACRAGLKTVLFESLMPGGQVINAEKIENFPGFPEGISGADFGPLLYEQAARYGLEIRLSEVTGLRQQAPNWAIDTYDGQVDARAVIVAGGSTLRTLGVPGEEGLVGSGVSYCATCDGPFFKDEVVGVVGGGDSAMDEALVLAEFASRVIVFHRRDELRAQKLLQDRALSNPKIEVRWNTTVDAILGDAEVEGVGVTDVSSGETSRVDLAGVFIYVGLDPNSQYLRDVLPLDNAGHIATDVWMRTPMPGLLAAGDIRQNSAAQLVTSAGDGATAAIAAERYLKGQQWPDFRRERHAHFPSRTEVMSVEEVIAALKAERGKFKEFGVKDVGLIGSFLMYVGPIHPSIDLVAEFEPERDTANALLALSQHLEHTLGVDVHVEAAERIRSRKSWPWKVQKPEYVSIDD